MRVSIITATYNSQEHILDCLNSIINQDYEDIELIIIDGNSTDNTNEIIEKFINDKPIKKITYISENDKGVYDALNKGISISSGDLIGFVHSDDILNSNNTLSYLVKEVNTKKIDGVYGNLHYVSAKNIQHTIRKWDSSPFHPNLLKMGWMPPHPTLFLKRQVYDMHGCFNLKYKISADYDLILRVFQDENLKFGYIDKTITRMRIGGISNRSLTNIFKKSLEDFKSIKKNNTGNFLTLIKKNISKLRQFNV